MTAAVRLVVLRHGATDLTHRVLNGGGPNAADPGLSAEGRAQVTWARERLASIGCPPECWSSPARRARQSAAAVGFAEPEVRALLAEVDFGRWEGLAPARIQADDAAVFRRWWSNPQVSAPGGTALADLAAGLVSLVESLLTEGVGRDLLLVGHASTVRVGTALALGLPLVEAARIQAAPGSVAELRFWPDGGSCLDSLDSPRVR